VGLWRRQLNVAAEVKHRRFGKMAARCWDFLGADYGDLYKPPLPVDGEEYPELQEPIYKIRRNLTFDYVATFLPFVFHQVPHRQVEPSRHDPPPEMFGMPPGQPMPPGPLAIQDRTRAWLMQWWLNYTPTEYDYRGECRRSLIEALVKGRGVQWIEMVPGSTGGLIPAAMYGSVNDLNIDPDADRLNEAGWCSRHRRSSVWRLAEQYGLPRKELQGRIHSYQNQAGQEEGEPPVADDGRTGDDRQGDVAEYDIMWTRGLGLGQKLLGGDDALRELDSGVGRLAQIVESLGHNCWLVIVPGLPYPANLPPEVMETATDAEIKARLEWPIPFHQEQSNPWPFVVCDFYPDTDSCWAQSPIKAALPLQEFIDRTYSFMMGRVRAACKLGLVCDAGLEEDFTNWLKSGVDLQIIQVKGHVAEDLQKKFAQVEFKQLHADLLKVVQMVELAFEKSTGMTSLLQGAQGGTQIRSASEAQIRQGHSMNRPEDMSECAEDWQSRLARAEGFATRVLVPGEVVAPLFGEQQQETVLGAQPGPFTQAWQQLVNAPPEVAAAELSYRIEAGTAQRRNKQTMTANAEMLMQALGPTLLQYVAINPAPWNALVRFLGDAYGMRLDDMMLAPPPMQPQMPGQQPAPGPPQPGQQPAPQPM
jgi:hypothetical protein